MFVLLFPAACYIPKQICKCHRIFFGVPLCNRIVFYRRRPTAQRITHGNHIASGTSFFFVGTS